MSRRDPNETRETALLILGCVMCAAWVIAILVQVINPKHVVPTEVHGVILVLLPLLFGGAWVAGRKQQAANQSARDVYRAALTNNWTLAQTAENLGIPIDEVKKMIERVGGKIVRGEIS